MALHYCRQLLASLWDFRQVCENLSSGGFVRFCWRLSGILVASTPIWAGLATAYQDDTHFYIENDVLKIAVLRSTGSLDGIIHKRSGVNLQSRNVNNYPGIWTMS